MPLIPALRRQRHADLCEFEVNLVYRASSRTANATERTPVSTIQKEVADILFKSKFLHQ